MQRAMELAMGVHSEKGSVKGGDPHRKTDRGGGAGTRDEVCIYICM